MGTPMARCHPQHRRIIRALPNLQGAERSTFVINHLEVVERVEHHPPVFIPEPSFDDLVSLYGDASRRCAETADRLKQDETVLRAKAPGHALPDVPQDDACIGWWVGIRAARLPLIPNPTHQATEDLLIAVRTRHHLVEPFQLPEVLQYCGVLVDETEAGKVSNPGRIGKKVDGHQGFVFLLPALGSTAGRIPPAPETAPQKSGCYSRQQEPRELGRDHRLQSSRTRMIPRPSRPWITRRCSRGEPGRRLRIWSTV